jgi:hypothetical protein
MTEREGVAHDLPAVIHTLVDLRQLLTAIRKIEANWQTSVQPGLFYSSNHRRPTLFLVDVNAISLPLLDSEDIPTFGEKKASRWDWHYLFLIRRKVEWSLGLAHPTLGADNDKPV